ncbi:MAG TPA: YdcF family protein [Polyangiaceae bacterium]|nr:YdcF family protein [Polyangiaceae bacterium]
MGEFTSPNRPDALVVLGCREGGAFDRRIDAAARAFEELDPLVVVASGGRRWSGRAEADALAERLIARAVPEERVVRELCSLSTLENAAYTAELLRERGVRRAVIVTCDFHAARALLCFSLMGVDAEIRTAKTPVPRRGRALREWLSRAIDHRAATAWTVR